VAKETKQGFGAVGLALVGFAIGYFTTSLLRGTTYADRAPLIATALGVVLAMFAARQSGRMIRGALRGLCIGTAVGVGVLMFLMQPPAGEGAVVQEADLLAKRTWIVTSIPDPGPLAAAMTALAINPPTLRLRTVPTGPGPAGLITVLVPALCCLAAGAVYGLTTEKRRAEGPAG